MWSGDSKKKRKAPSDPPKSWKGRVLLQNKTVKKPETVTRKVVWFSTSEPKECDGTPVVDLTGKVLCSDVIKARQCLDFELHFKMGAQVPASTKLMVFVGLHKSDTGEEIKDGVVNNFSYLQCSSLYGVAVFSKLYLETRSQFSHFLEFTLWAERPRPPDLVGSYDRETYYQVPGTNTYRTPYFIPNAASKKASQTPKTEDPDAAPITFIRMIPNRGEADTITYLTFESTTKDTTGEIYVIWNDEILHVPFYSKGNHQNIIVIEKVPRSTSERVPVYLKEKPAQDSRSIGYSSNPLYFTYSSYDQGGAPAGVQPDNMFIERTRPASNPSSPHTQYRAGTQPNPPSTTQRVSPGRNSNGRLERRRSFSLIPSLPSPVVRRRATSEGSISDRKPVTWRSTASSDSGSYEDYSSSVEKKIRLSNLHISSPPIGRTSDSESIESSDCELRCEQDNMDTTKFQSFKQIHQIRNSSLSSYDEDHHRFFSDPGLHAPDRSFSQVQQVPTFQNSQFQQQFQPHLLHHYQEPPPQLHTGNGYGFMPRPGAQNIQQMPAFRPPPFQNSHQSSPVFSWPSDHGGSSHSSHSEDGDSPMANTGQGGFYGDQHRNPQLTPSGRLPILANKDYRMKQRRKVPSHDLFKNTPPLLQKIDEEPGNRSSREVQYLFHNAMDAEPREPYDKSYENVIDPLPGHQLDVDSFFL